MNTTREEQYLQDKIVEFEEKMALVQYETALRYFDAGEMIYPITDAQRLVPITEREKIEYGDDYFQMESAALEEIKAVENQMSLYQGIESLKEAKLLFSKEKMFGIYQISADSMARKFRFMGMRFIEQEGHELRRVEYNLIYTGELWDGYDLEEIYEKFNINHPEDYRGHSLSVSDIVVINENGKIQSYFVDSISFQELPEFIRLEEMLREEVAYKIGEKYFAIQTSEEGYDYSFYDEEYRLLDGGVYDEPEKAMYDVIEDLLEDEGIAKIERIYMDYDELQEKVAQVDTKILLKQVANVEEQEKKPFLEFYAASVGEFHSMGKYEESTDLSFIASKYREYLDSPESLYSTGELGIIYHDPVYSLYDGSELGIVVGKTIHGEHLELVPFMAEKEIVHEAVKQIREHFPEFRYIPAKDIENILYPDKMTTEQLATALVDIAKEYDPYEYFDTVELGKDIVNTIMMDLKVGGAHQYISYLKDIVEDECEYSQKAGVLIKRLKSYSFDELKEMEPVVHVDFCEKAEFIEKKYQSLDELDQKVRELDAQLSADRDEKTGQAKKLVMIYLTLYYPGDEKVEKMKAKLCIGDGYGGIVNHLKMDVEMKLTDESWIRYQKGKGEEAYSAYLADMTNLQENVLPYLQQFVALEEQHPITSKESVVVDQDVAKKQAVVKKEQDVNADKLSIHERLARNKEKIQMQSARNEKENGIEIG